MYLLQSLLSFFVTSILLSSLNYVNGQSGHTKTQLAGSLYVEEDLEEGFWAIFNLCLVQSPDQQDFRYSKQPLFTILLSQKAVVIFTT